jgi:hypothetical protein
MIFRRILFVLLVAMLSGCIKFHSNPVTPGAPGTAAQQDEVTAVATGIIKAMDQEEFGPVWDQSSDILKRLVSKPMFAKTFSDVQKQLGQPGPRSAPRFGFHKKIEENLPEGEYAIVEFDVEHTPQYSTQKVVLAKEAGHWKLAGYFIIGKGTK